MAVGSLRVSERHGISTILLDKGVFVHESYLSSSKFLSAVSANGVGDFDDLQLSGFIECEICKRVQSERAVWCLGSVGAFQAKIEIIARYLDQQIECTFQAKGCDNKMIMVTNYCIIC